MSFWQTKTLAQMNRDEWEALCDGCGQCCLHKLEDEDDGEYYFTKVACRLLDCDSARCKNYAQRKQYVPQCVQLGIENVENFHWLPSNCAYRLLADGEPLPAWHPLVSDSPDSVQKAGQSVIGRVISETELDPDPERAEQQLQDMVIYWVE
ncbi:MAG: YcgN family cysteine cluster protein [Cellvibrionaceae bacterium]|nr:YcgN family cysteine cluster protein [Cellvibrionaceae bacterium]